MELGVYILWHEINQPVFEYDFSRKHLARDLIYKQVGHPVIHRHSTI